MTNSFHANIISIYGDKGRNWLDSLPQTIENLIIEYGLTDVKTDMQDIQLSFNYIFFARFKGGDAVVKISPKKEDSRREAETIKYFNGQGMVKLLAHKDNIIIMERAIPGLLLDKKDSISLKMACGVMRDLHSASAKLNRSNFISIEEWLKPIDESWGVREDIIAKARTYKNELLPKYNKRILLHGDLHHDNILSHNNSYVAIDPKGVIGDPINEAWSMVVDYEKDTKFIADFFSFKLEDLRKWYFVHVALAACWCLEDNISPEKFIKLCDNIYQA